MALQRLVVPIDFSDDSASAARLALSLAGWDGAKVCLLHVDAFPDPVTMPPQSGRLWHAVEAHYRRRLEVQVERMRADLARLGAGGVELISALRRGDPAEGICSFASEWDADLLVLGAHGGPGSVRYLLGSVSARVAREAPCPVLITRPGASEDLGRGGRFHRALVAVDYSAFSVPCAELAFELLHPTGALEFIHVWQPPAAFSVGTDYEHVVEVRTAAEVEALQAFAARFGGGAIELSSRVERGNPPQEILGEAKRFPADFIVLGSHGRHGLLEHVTGTVADRVLRHADVPVLLMPQRALRSREIRARLGAELAGGAP